MNTSLPWKPPVWLLLLDCLGMALLALGLHVHYAPIRRSPRPWGHSSCRCWCWVA